MSTSTVNSATSTNMTRITGMASGLDVDSLVTKLMTAERLPYNKLGQQKQKLQWTQDAYRDMSTLIMGFKSSYFDVTNPTNNMRSTSVYKQFNTTATNSDSSDLTQYVTATSNADASAGNHTISVSALAETAKIQGSTLSGVGVGAVLASSVELTAGNGSDISANDTLIINGKTIKLSDATYNSTNYKDLLADIQSKINAEPTLNGKVSVTLTADNKLMMKSTDGSEITLSGSALGELKLCPAVTGESLTTPDLTSNNTLKINGETLTLSNVSYDGSSGKTLTDLVNDIQTQINANSTLNGNVTASLTSDNKLILKSAGGSITVSGNALAPLKLSPTVTGVSLTTPDLTSKHTLTIDGQSLTLSAVSYDGTAGKTLTDLLADIQSKIAGSTLNGKVTASLTSDNKLMFSSSDGSMISLDGDALSKLGLNINNTYSGTSTLKTISTSSTLASLGITDNAFNLSMNINGVATGNIFSSNLSSTATVASMMQQFNSSSVAQNNGLVMSFDSVNEKFKIESKNTGSNVNFQLNANDYSAKLGLTKDTSTAATVQGKDAVVTIDGVTMTNSKNTVLANGVTYSLLKTTGSSSVNVNTSQNIDGVVKKIQDFVAKYNELIGKIDDKVSEKYDRTYQPLTDEQKDAMKDTDITNWETKAKTGLLHDDSTLQGMLNDMRQALDGSVKGVKYTLSDVGITTGQWYDGGKLNIDETKLRNALTNDPDGVTKLFSAESSVAYPMSNDDPNAAPDKVKQRYDENGLINRLYDIINNNVGTTGDKGRLLQKAGIKGDTSEYDNTIYKQMKDITKDMTDMAEKLKDKETAYYNKFSQLETYMNNMNNQSSWLTQQLSKM